MYVPTVEDKDAVPVVRYRIPADGRLGAGATADVWRGRAEDAGTEVAVKIATLVDPQSLAAFWAEYDLLNKLAGTESSSNVPWVHRGHAPSAPNSAILIMEMARAEWQLSRHENDGRLTENVALPAGVQYARLLKSLHALGYSTRGDRKATDLRWDADAKRLIVLDWNRAERMTDVAQNNARAELIQQDIAGFGQLWADRLLGKQYDRAPIAGDEVPVEWRHVSRGLRRILARSLGQGGLLPYASANELLDDLTTHHEQRQAAIASQGRQSLRDAIALKQKAETGDPATTAEWADDALDLLDLAERPAGAAGVPPTEVAALKQWASSALNSPEVEAQRAIRRARALMLQQNYRQAYQTLDEVLDHLKSDARLVLRQWRWLKIASVARDGNERGVTMTESHAHMVVAIEKLEEAAREPAASGAAQVDLKRAEQSLDAAIASLERDDLRAMLKPLQLEIHARRALGEKPPATEVATGDFAQLRQLDDFYAAQLRKSVPELHAGILQTLATDAMSAARNNDLGTFAGAAQRAIETPLDEDKATQAHKAYLALGQRRHALNPQDQALCAAVLWLHDAHECLKRYQPASAYQIACVPPAGALQALPHLAGARNALLAATSQAVTEAVRAAMQDTLLPVELRACSESLSAINEPAHAQAEARALLEEIERRRASSLALGGELVALLNGARVTSPDAEPDARALHMADCSLAVPDDPERILDPDLPARVDGILREARQQQIELFDIDPNIEGAGVWRVKSLLAGRSSRRILDKTIAFKAALQELTSALQAQEGNAQEALRTVQAWDGVQQLAQAGAADNMSSDIARLEALATRWAALQNKLPKPQEVTKTVALASLLANEIKPAEGTLSDLSAKAEAINHAGAALSATNVQSAVVEMEKVRSGIRRACVLQGLQAIREINRTDLQTALAYVERIQPATSRDSEAEVNLLKAGDTWLQAVDARPNLQATIVAWRQAVLTQNLKDAAVKRATFWQLVAGNVLLQQHWVTSELELHHAALLTAQVPLVNGAPAQDVDTPAAMARHLYAGVEALRDIAQNGMDIEFYRLLADRQKAGDYLTQSLLLDWRSQVHWAFGSCEHTNWLLQGVFAPESRDANWAIWLLQESYFHLAGVLDRLSPVPFSLCYGEWKHTTEQLLQALNRWMVDTKGTHDLIDRGSWQCKDGEDIIAVWRRQVEIKPAQAPTTARK